MTACEIPQVKSQAIAPNAQCAEAILVYSSLANSCKDDATRAQMLYQMAAKYDQCADRNASMEVLRRLASEYPNYSGIREVHFRLGEGDYRLANFAGALGWYATDADDPAIDQYTGPAEYKRGFTLYKLGRTPEAARSFSRVLQLSSAAFTDHDAETALKTDARNAEFQQIVQACAQGEEAAAALAAAAIRSDQLTHEVNARLRDAHLQRECVEIFSEARCQCTNAVLERLLSH